MFRRLSAIEIAEGALLADIAVIFHLLTLYLPIGGTGFVSSSLSCSRSLCFGAAFTQALWPSASPPS